MTAAPATTAAIEASVQLGRRLGLHFEQPELIADGYSVRVRLGPVLTRVITRGLQLRGDPQPWMQRELAVTRWLSECGAAVIAPWPDPGPHRVADTFISLWPFVTPVAPETPPTGERFGQALSELHTRLDDCPLPLPLLVGPLTDIQTGLRQSQHRILHRAAAALLPRVADWPRRPLHGDAHPGNLMRTMQGWVWIDFEDACLGPPEWDLASMSLDETAVQAYRHPIDDRRLQDCRRLRRLQVLASLLADGARDDELPPGLLRSLDLSA